MRFQQGTVLTFCLFETQKGKKSRPSLLIVPVNKLALATMKGYYFFMTADPHEQYFKTSRVDADLRGQAIRGGALSLLSNATKFVVRLGSTMILARILTPHDYGLVAMVVVVSGMLVIFKDLGLTMATVQRAEINHAQVSTLFWINVIFGIILMLIMAALSPVLAWFYEETQLVGIGLALSSIFVFSGLSVQHEALLRRQMRFGVLMIIETLSALAAAGAAIFAALAGLDYWALVIQQIVMLVLFAMCLWLACGWRPSKPQPKSQVGAMLSFGRELTGFHLVNYLARHVDKLLVGKMWGSEPLGVYNKAFDLFLLPLAQINYPITAVATPTLSRLQHQEDRFRHYYLKAVFLISSLTVPLMALLALLAEETILIVLGPQWNQAAIIFKILAIAGLVQPILSTSGLLYISLGRTKRLFRWGVFASSVIVAGFAIGLYFGPQGVATGYTVSILLLAWPCIAYATQGTPVTTKDVLAAASLPFLSCLVATLGVLGINHFILPSGGLWSTVLLDAGSMTIIYTLMLFVVFRKWHVFVEIARELLIRTENEK
jgi:PST family polysaccharide transporter